MSNKEIQTQSSGGLTVCGLLGVAFVILKLCGVIDWSWWLVTLPFWGGLAILIIIAIAALAIAGIIDLLDK